MVAIAYTQHPHKFYKAYPQRWFLLLTVCLLSLSNATIWISYSSISMDVDAFYCRRNVSSSSDEEKCDVSYWTTQIFQIGATVTGILGMYVTDKYGIKVSCLFATLFNFVGASIRFLSTTSFIPFGYQILVLYAGQTIASLSQSFFLVLPPKVAEFWFPESQRTIANALAFIANLIGVVIGSLTPSIVFTSKGVDTSFLLLTMNGIITFIAADVLLLSFLIRSGRPPTPPSASMENHSSPPFFEGLLMLFKNKEFYVQMITSNFGFAILYSLFFAGEEMFTKLGYPDINGFGLALASLVGCVAALFAGFAADRTKKFNEIVKFCYLGSALTALGINMFLRFQHRSNLNLGFLYVFIAVLSFFCTPTWPVGLELGVEATYPVAEATSSGVLITCGMLALFVISYAMKGISNIGLETSAINCFQLALDFWCVVVIAVAVFTFFFLNPRHKRLEYEEKKEALDQETGGDFVSRY